jgi:formate dehydrogenase iron-sulfur subunit
MLKFLVDTYSNLCIKCKGCEAICKNQNKVPEGIFRIRVITIKEGTPEQLNIPMACMHCNNPPCLRICPRDAIYKREDGIVLVNKDKCIGCGYCTFACPFGAPQFEESGAFGTKGKMDKCTFCVQPYKQNEVERKALPRCAIVCPTESLLGGEASEIIKEFGKRARGYIASGFVEILMG